MKAPKKFTTSENRITSGLNDNVQYVKSILEVRILEQLSPLPEHSPHLSKLKYFYKRILSALLKDVVNGTITIHDFLNIKEDLYGIVNLK